MYDLFRTREGRCLVGSSSHRPTAPQRDGCEAHFGWGVTAPERRTAGGARALTIPRPAACRRRPEARERVRRAGRVHGDSTVQYLYTAVHARGSRPPAILHRTAPTHRPYRCTPSCTVHSRRADLDRYSTRSLATYTARHQAAADTLPAPRDTSATRRALRSCAAESVRIQWSCVKRYATGWEGESAFDPTWT